MMLIKDPDLRPSASEVLSHKWFSAHSSNSQNNSLKTKSYLDSLSKFNASTKLSQAIMTYIVSNISYKEVTSDILSFFKKLDSNGDGKISKQELIDGFVKTYPYKKKHEIESEVEEIMSQIDSNISGTIDYTEFLVACLNREKILSQQLVAQAFKQFDLNGDGYVTQAEFQAVMGGVVLDQKSWNEFLIDCDSDKDGKVGVQKKVINFRRFRSRNSSPSLITSANKVAIEH